MNDLTAVPLTTLKEEEQHFRESVASFAREQIGPHVSEMDEQASFRHDLIEAFFDLGLMGMEIPEPYGGSGSSFFMSILAVEELSRIDASAGVIVDVQNTLVNGALLQWGTEEQKARYLPRLAREWVGAYALSEAGSGSDAFALEARARYDNGFFHRNGQKLWVTNGKEASLFIVFATTDPGLGYKGITAFLVERTLEGFEVGEKKKRRQTRHPGLLDL